MIKRIKRMDEKDFRDKFSSIMYKAMKLEAENPHNSVVSACVGVAIGASISLLASIGCIVNINEDDKQFVLRHKINVEFNAQNIRQVGSRNIGYVSPNYAYQRLTDIDNGLDSLDKAITIADDIEREFTQNNWGKNWK